MVRKNMRKKNSNLLETNFASELSKGFISNVLFPEVCPGDWLILQKKNIFRQLNFFSSKFLCITLQENHLAAKQIVGADVRLPHISVKQRVQVEVFVLKTSRVIQAQHRPASVPPSIELVPIRW